MTGYHQPAEPKWTLSLIILSKKNPVVQHNTDYEKLSSKPLSLLSNITHSIIPLMHFSTPPLPHKNMLLIRPVCVHICVFLYVRLCGSWTDSSEPVYTYRPCSYWLRSGDPYPSCVGDPSTLTGPLYHHSSQTLTNDSH